VVIAEEWQTSWSMVELGARTRRQGWDGDVRLFWNANNIFGFERVPWRALNESATITTVSRFMKHEMWRYGIDARVLPNGIAAEWLMPFDRRAVGALKQAADGRVLLAKVARWDPDKRWLMAVDAVRELKERGLSPLLVARGGLEQHGQEVMSRAQSHDLVPRFVSCQDDSPPALCVALAESAHCDIVVIESRLSRPQLQCLYRASDAVLANSGVEPFGLVGLEAMASGAVAVVGATGEDYATPGHDAISLQTSAAHEITANVLRLRRHPDLAHRLRHEARRTGARYTWGRVIQTHVLPMLA
jgi:glycosyltransferase involved in cell wall biosynthesis